MLINIIGALIVFCAGLFVGLKIKQQFYETLLENWKNSSQRQREQNYEQLLMIIETFEKFYEKYKALAERRDK